MKKPLLIAAALFLVITSPILAQDNEPKPELTIEKFKDDQSLQRNRSGQTLGETLRSPGVVRSRKPLFVVDGVVSTEEGKPDPMDIKVSDISSIAVVDDPAQLTMYGPKGADGVILITTKNAKVKEN
jgi:TonB-dependent SusC/RagA subfamily outer membrane receptor